MDDEQPTPEELEAEQLERETAEHEIAARTDLPAEEHAAERRADKAAYLREKLQEQREADAAD